MVLAHGDIPTYTYTYTYINTHTHTHTHKHTINGKNNTILATFANEVSEFDSI